MTQKSTIAVIGLGNIGSIVATNLVKGNRAVIVADRTAEKAAGLAKKLGPLATPKTIVDAIKEADIVVLAVWFSAIKELLAQYASELQGKIIIDPSNPIAPDDKGGFKKIIDEHTSAGEVLSAVAPKNATFVKALGTLSAASLAGAAFQKPEAAVLFYATDNTSVADAVELLIKDSGFAPAYVGGIDKSIKIEVFGDLHEFGALGKTITLSALAAKA
ncbi:MAG: NAD(P)-binding domain-containing protein [Filimonas sp.]|nr:NAD(P)-binding domain-containing protein [Filimonas sp.]